jgi:hypothetical protein
MLALAWHEYHDEHGHFPPPYVADANGKPTHSWRVLILPYLEENALYKAYNFKEPWNGPNNSKLVSQMPRCFRCPSETRLPPNTTSYFCVVGPGRAKHDRPHLSLSDFKEPTIMLVESNTAQVNWLEPRDLTIDDVIGSRQSQSGRPASSNHRVDDHIWRSGYWFHVALVDASIRPIPDDIDSEVLRALLTMNGGEQVDIPYFTSPKRLRPEFVVLVSLTFAFVVLAILRRVRLARQLRNLA